MDVQLTGDMTLKIKGTYVIISWMYITSSYAKNNSVRITIGGKNHEDVIQFVDNNNNEKYYVIIS